MSSPDGLLIDGVAYFSAADVAKSAGVTRQTLWRWRQDGKVPVGRKYRDKQVVFTRAESDAIREYAHRLEPISRETTGGSELRQFGAREASNGEQ